MKIKKITILDASGKKVYKGGLVGLKYHKEAVKRVCIETFNDENPCIIHESYALSVLADQVELILLNLNRNKILITNELLSNLPDVDLTHYLGFTIELEVK